MLYIIAGITGTCALLCAAEVIVRIWDKLDQTNKEKSAATAATVNSARVRDTNTNTIIIYPERRCVK